MMPTECTECGSTDLVESGTFRHETWIHKLICLTCRKCLAVTAFAQDLAGSALPARS